MTGWEPPGAPLGLPGMGHVDAAGHHLALLLQQGHRARVLSLRRLHGSARAPAVLHPQLLRRLGAQGARVCPLDVRDLGLWSPVTGGVLWVGGGGGGEAEKGLRRLVAYSLCTPAHTHTLL